MFHQAEALLSPTPRSEKAPAVHAVYANNAAACFHIYHVGPWGLGSAERLAGVERATGCYANAKIESQLEDYRSLTGGPLRCLGVVMMSSRVPEYARPAVAQEAILKVALDAADACTICRKSKWVCNCQG